MAKKIEAGRSKGGHKLLDAARANQDALQTAGLQGSTIDKYEKLLKAIEGKGKELGAAAQVLVKDIARAADAFQAAMRKEFPGNTSFQKFFHADKPLPTGAHELLALAREIAQQAPDFSSNLIKHALNAASVKHLTFLADQLEQEIGGAEPHKDVAELEKVILEVAHRALEGKPELSKFK